MNLQEFPLFISVHIFQYAWVPFIAILFILQHDLMQYNHKLSTINN